MSAKSRAERIGAISLTASQYGGAIGEAMRDLAEIVGTLLPAEAAQPCSKCGRTDGEVVDLDRGRYMHAYGACPKPAPVDLPASFVDEDGDIVEVHQIGGKVRLRVVSVGGTRRDVNVQSHDVDRFIAAVLKAAGR